MPRKHVREWWETEYRSLLDEAAEREERRVRQAVWTALMLIFREQLVQATAVSRAARRHKVSPSRVAYYAARATGEYPARQQAGRRGRKASTSSARGPKRTVEATTPTPAGEAVAADEVRARLRGIVNFLDD